MEMYGPVECLLDREWTSCQDNPPTFHQSKQYPALPIIPTKKKQQDVCFWMQMEMFGSMIQLDKNTSTDQEKLASPHSLQSNPSVPQADFRCFWTMNEMCGLKDTVKRAVWELKALRFKNIK